MSQTDELNLRTNRLPGLDLLRIIAISFILFSHYPDSPINGNRKYITFCLELIFMLSGFLLSSQIFFSLKNHKKINYFKYYLSRILKLYPPYLILLGIFYLSPYFSNEKPAITEYIFLTFNLNFNEVNLNIIYHTWALCLEFHFALILPIGAYAFTRLKKQISLCIIGFLILSPIVIRFLIWSYLISKHTQSEYIDFILAKEIYHPSYARFDALLIGSLLAFTRIYENKIWSFLTNYKVTLFLVSVILFPIAMYFLGTYYKSGLAVSFNYWIISVLLIPTFVMCTSEMKFLTRLFDPFFSYFAEIGYSVYLVHTLTFLTSTKIITIFFPNLRSIGSFLFHISFMLIWAMMIFHLIEKPSLKLRQLLIKGHRG